MKRGVLELRFAATECRRCGGTRLLRQPCPDCGQVPQPHEVQPDFDRRRTLIDAFRAGRRAAETPAITAADATQQFVRAEHEVLHQLSRAAKSGRDATGLVRAFGELDDVVVALELPRPRPHRNIGRAHGRAARAVLDGLELFVEALTAPSIVAAQDFERRGQRLPDSGAKILNDARAESELWDAAHDMPLQDVAAAKGLSARDAAGADGLSVGDLDARLQQIFGRSADVRPGLGIELHVIRGVLVGALDLEESAAVAGEAERLFLESEGLAALLGSPSWIAEQNRGMALMSAALFGLATMRDDASDLKRIDQLLNVLIKCRESMVPHFLATIASPDLATYDRLRASRSGKVIDGGARRHPGLRLEEHLDVRLRHAGAHVAFDVEGDQVRLKYGTHGDVVAAR